ncbi:MAG: NADH-quinone oxidoreductase subunit NuoE [Deltaproteobacteria bacterium]|nr:NADH-quinone oxidoreductase subunit NuoE [Deltaproteobacteria bacterium]
MTAEPDVARELAEILSHYSGAKSELIPILQDVQEKLGYLPEEVMQRVAKFLRLTDNTVYGVSTFYAQFSFTPTGRNKVTVCRGTACHVRGGARILAEIERRLGIKEGETTDDLEYTLETTACFGSCALAPVVVINKNVYGRVTTAKLAEILTMAE